MRIPSVGLVRMAVRIRTAGLKRPPVIRKNTHALTARENPNARATKSRFEVFGAEEIVEPGVV